jgi:TPR repeat protein
VPDSLDNTSTAELHQRVRSVLNRVWPKRDGGILTVQEVADRCGVTKGAAGKWRTAAQIPKPAARERLVALVAEKLSREDADELEFCYRILAETQRVKTNRRLAKAAAGGRDITSKRPPALPLWLYRLHSSIHLLDDDIPTVEDRMAGDPPNAAQHWKLASSITGGTIPPYVGRTRVDRVLDRRLAAPSSGRIAILIGDPKSGKTRTAIEAIRRQPMLRLASLHEPRAPTDGHDTLATYVEALLTAAPHAADRTSFEGIVVFIDDIHNHLRNPASGSARGTSLRTHCTNILHAGATVVATCHPHVLTLPPDTLAISHEDQDWIRNNSIPVDAALDDVELADAHRLIGTEMDLRRLGSALAGIDELRRHVTEAINDPSPPGPARAAVIAALCDAALFLFYRPTVPQIERFARYYLKGPRAKDRIRDAIEWATTPLLLGTPIAIAQYDDATNTCALTDALRYETLRDHSPSVDLKLGSAEAYNAGIRLNELGLEEMAVAWHRRAADLNRPSAMNNLGVIRAEQGRVDDDDPDGAIYWFRRAANLDHRDSMHNLGVIRSDQGRVDDDDPDGAIYWYRRAADLNKRGSMFNLAFIRQEQGRVDDDDPDDAIHWYRRAANLNHPGSMYNLGIIRKGQGRVDDDDDDDDPDGAIYWYRRAANLNHPGSIGNLGIIRYDQGRVDDDDPDGAIYWYRRAANLNHADSMYNLGIIRYEQGRVDDDDPDGAIHWFRRGADLNHPDSAFNLGMVRYEQGRVDDDDPDDAIHWFRRGADLNHPNSAFNLGVIRYGQGRVDDDDPDGAIYWYRRAADLNHAGSMHNLGIIRQGQGRVDDDDPDGAKYWQGRAAAE